MKARDLRQLAKRAGWSVTLTGAGHLRLEHPEAAGPVRLDAFRSPGAAPDARHDEARHADEGGRPMKKPEGPDKDEIEGIKLRRVPGRSKAHPWKVQLDYVDADGNRKNPAFNNWNIARDKAREIGRKLHDRTEVAVGENPKFNLAWAEYIKWCEERAQLKMKMEPGSLRNIQTVGKLLLKEFDNKPVRSITSLHLEQWHMKLGTQYGFKDSTRGSYLVRWSPFFDFCKKRKWIAHNPMRVDRIEIGRWQKRADVPSWDDVDVYGEFLHGPRPSLAAFGVKSGLNVFAWAKRRVIHALGAYGGLRPQEIAALRWERINLQRAFLEIDDEEGAVGFKRGIKEPKSEAGARVVPISQYLYDELTWYGDYLTGTGRPPEKGFVVFPNVEDKGRKFLAPEIISNLHSTGLVLAGIVRPDGKRKYGQHALRHFYCSASLLLGVVPEVVAKRAGHKTGAFTSKTYAHVLKTDEEGYIDEIPNEPIWRERFKRAQPPAPLVQLDDKGEVIDVVPDAVLVQGRYEAAGGANLPALFSLDGPRGVNPRSRAKDRLKAVPEFVHQALALICAGWHLPDLPKRVGRSANRIQVAFREAGLPSPHQCVIRVRAARFRELVNMEYTDIDIARIMNTDPNTVLKQRQADGLAAPAKFLKEHGFRPVSTSDDATDLRQNQLKLL